MAFARDWLESEPQDHTKFKIQPGGIREHKVDISDRLKDFFYGFTSGETYGGIKKLVMYAQGTAPSTVADAIIGFGSDWAGKCEFTFLGEDGTFIQATRLGKILLDSGVLTNQCFLKSINAAGTGLANIIKANASDLPELPDGALLGSGTAPTTDAAISNKKYVDDRETAIRADFPAFGAWVTDLEPAAGGGSAAIVKDTVYLAATDGFVILGRGEGGSTYQAFTDGSNPPTTIRGQSGGGAADVPYQTITMPVRKGDYWKFTCVVGGPAFVYWLPIGA